MSTATKLIHQEFRDFGEVPRAFDSWNLATMQIAPGSAKSIIRVLKVGELEVLFNKETHSSVSNWQIDNGKTTIAFYEAGMTPGAWCGNEVGPDHMLVTSSGRDHFARTPPNLCMVMITAKTDLLDRYGALPRSMAGRAYANENAVLPIGHSGAILRNFLFELMASASVQSIQEVHDLQEEILCMLGSTFDEVGINTTSSARMASSAGLVKRAFQLALDCSKPVEVGTLASELGVSPRLLHHAFRKEIGLNPRRCLLQLRLQRVRSELLRASPGDILIKQVARRNGFVDLGRFAEYYMRMYGELPSNTLVEG